MDQATIEKLLRCEKEFEAVSVTFPKPGIAEHYALKAHGSNANFMLDINRYGQFKLTRCTFNERAHINFVLIRLDLDESKPHKNPDGSIINGPHIHIARLEEGQIEPDNNAPWAFLLSEYTDDPLDLDDLPGMLEWFCKECNIKLPNIQGSM